jgi:hypothetical protein
MTTNRSKLALEQLKTYGIDIPPKFEKDVISYPYQDDIFPVFLGDDGGYDYFLCEAPICKNGDLIKVGIRYDTHNFDNCLVTGMKLDGYFKSRWIIKIYDQEFGEAELLVYEFLNIAF